MDLADRHTIMRTRLWCIPVLLALHNIEEALTMPSWVMMHLPMLQSKFFFLRFVSFSSLQIYISLLLVTAGPFLLAWICLQAPLTKGKVFLMLILQSVVGWNALVPHLSGVVLLGMYNPGTVTAVVCNLPFTVYLLRKSMREGIISRKEVQGIVLTGLAVYVPLVYINHLLAQTIASIIG